MRKAINENPMVQIAVLGIAAVIFAFILFTSVLKKDDTAASSATDPVAATATDPSAGATSSGTVAPADSTATPPTSDPTASGVTPPATATPPTEVPSGGGTVSDGLLPSKGLPRDLLVAFAKNKTIALLVIDPRGTSDKQVKSYTKTLEHRDDVEVFIVDVKDISKYSRVTAGVSVSRVPALVVIRPRKLTDSVPTATVSYGFRGARSVNQAIDDAIYKGKELPSYPVDRKSKKHKGGSKNK